MKYTPSKTRIKLTERNNATKTYEAQCLQTAYVALPFLIILSPILLPLCLLAWDFIAYKEVHKWHTLNKDEWPLKYTPAEFSTLGEAKSFIDEYLADERRRHDLAYGKEIKKVTIIKYP